MVYKPRPKAFVYIITNILRKNQVFGNNKSPNLFTQLWLARSGPVKDNYTSPALCNPNFAWPRPLWAISFKSLIIDKTSKLKAGHYEILGETIANFEFFDNGFNPYSRYLDVDKIDLILRKRVGQKIQYIEVQVKYGRLYKFNPKWLVNTFDYTSWKFFKLDPFKNADNNLFVAYVFSYPDGYKGDIFIFPANVFNNLINSGIICDTKKGKQAKVYIAHSTKDNRWFLMKKWSFKAINTETTIDVTKYRRNFGFK